LARRKASREKRSCSLETSQLARQQYGLDIARGGIQQLVSGLVGELVDSLPRGPAHDVGTAFDRPRAVSLRVACVAVLIDEIDIEIENDRGGDRETQALQLVVLVGEGGEFGSYDAVFEIDQMTPSTSLHYG
jgi:hypothetical protein